MLLVGLDAASDFTKFGFALGQYEDGRVGIIEAGLIKTKDDTNALLSSVAPKIKSADKALIAIDAPLGWPKSMAEALQTHEAGQVISKSKDAMFHRETDRVIHRRLAKKPLEVGADKIARAAHSALGALQMLREATGEGIPLAWSRNFSSSAAIEVYPAATLKARGLPHSAYKKFDQAEVRHDISMGISAEIVGLDAYLDGSVDVFDACICLIAAKDFMDGLAEQPVDLELAEREGWIWVRGVNERPVSG
ncbi:MAG: DUF429 domain-containing protein [Chromatiales bacterium]|nr:DUF429 domain-containing protein [Chromatiales bacterium]